MKTLFVGDIHGAIEVVDMVSSQTYADKVVFIGDYIDSYKYGDLDQLKTIKTILSLVEEESDKYTALMGNHERSYLYKSERCSGYRYKFDMFLYPLKEKILDLLTNYIYVDGYLITHAGVNKKLLDLLEVSIEDYLSSSYHNQVGYARGGYSKYGGLYWNDWNMEFEPIPGINQIMGHTHYRYEGSIKTITAEDSMNYNIDCLSYDSDQKIEDSVFLVMEDGTPHTLNWSDLEDSKTTSNETSLQNESSRRQD